MILARISQRRPARWPGALLMLMLTAAPAVGSLASSNALLSQAPPPAQQLARPDPESLLIEVYKDLGASRLAAASEKANALVAAYPTFRLGHLIRGDLLLMHTRPVRNFGALTGAPEDKLKDLRDEAMVRLRSLQERPDPNLVPQAVLQVGEDQKNVFVVDISRSRLYVYDNHAGQLTFQADYYISQGKLGANKTREGDQRTPIGVYYINSRIPGPKLPDFYGTGALPLSYPNEWDKRNGRNGYGIWLHGTPSDNFSRPPLSSDGCVVLANPDLQSVYASAEVGKTSVVISPRVHFVKRTDAVREREDITAAMARWQQSLEGADNAHTLSYYSSAFRSGNGEDLATWNARQQKSMNGVRFTSVKLRDVSLFRYPGPEDMIVGTFTQESAVGRSKNTVRKRQYWVREGSQWKIIYEGNA